MLLEDPRTIHSTLTQSINSELNTPAQKHSPPLSRQLGTLTFHEALSWSAQLWGRAQCPPQLALPLSAMFAHLPLHPPPPHPVGTPEGREGGREERERGRGGGGEREERRGREGGRERERGRGGGKEERKRGKEREGEGRRRGGSGGGRGRGSEGRSERERNRGRDGGIEKEWEERGGGKEVGRGGREEEMDGRMEGWRERISE